MIDYSEFPPLVYFMRVLKNCPKSAFLYIQIWMSKGKYMSLREEKKDTRKHYLISPTMFRNLLAPLMFLNLIHMEEDCEKFQIDFMAPHSDDE